MVGSSVSIPLSIPLSKPLSTSKDVAYDDVLLLGSDHTHEPWTTHWQLGIAGPEIEQLANEKVDTFWGSRAGRTNVDRYFFACVRRPSAPY